MSITLSLARKLYFAAGIVWGVICGFVVVWVVGGGTAGLFWIFIFGDNVWPEWAWTIVHTLTIATGLPVFGACVYIGWKYSKQLETQTSGQTVDTRKALFLFISSIAVLLIFALYQIYIERSAQALKKSIADKHQRYFENISPVKKQNETDIEYYCRIVRKQSKITVSYRGDILKIVPEGLADIGNETILFAVAGPYEAIKAMGAEMVAHRNLSSADVLTSGQSVLPENIRCGNRMFFVRMNIPYYMLHSTNKIDVSIPSIRIRFPIKINDQA